jgi:DNA polymerase-1
VRTQARTLRLEEQVSARIREGTRYGVHLDPDVLTRLISETTTRLQTLQAEIWTLLGEDISLGRKAYLGAALLKLGVPITERTPTGLPTVRLPILARYADSHPVVPKLIAFAHLTTQQDNYLVKLHAAHTYFASQPWADGKVRFAFGHLGVPTGRMKCGGAGKGHDAYLKGVVDVNAQSIPDPHKTPDLPNIRSGFVAPRDMVVVAIDYNQMELRLMANLSGEPRWIETFKTGGDIHLSNAQAIADHDGPTPKIEKDDPRRSKAKATGFALIYGGDAHTVANHTGLTQKAADQLVHAFFTANPCIQRWMTQTAKHASQTKTARTFFGRIRHLHQYFPTPPPQPPRGTPKSTPESKAFWRYLKEKARGEREAINHPIQGTAADVFKHALTTLHTALAPYGPGLVSPPILWLHDEIVFYCHTDWVQTIVPIASAALTVTHPQWPVPLTVDAEVGPSWGTLIPYAQWIEKNPPEKTS